MEGGERSAWGPALSRGGPGCNLRQEPSMAPVALQVTGASHASVSQFLQSSQQPLRGPAAGVEGAALFLGSVATKPPAERCEV